MAAHSGAATTDSATDAPPWCRTLTSTLDDEIVVDGVLSVGKAGLMVRTGECDIYLTSRSKELARIERGTVVRICGRIGYDGGFPSKQVHGRLAAGAIPRLEMSVCEFEILCVSCLSLSDPRVCPI